MKYLIVYAHPNPKSFCAGILERVESTIKAKGDEAVVRDLYTMNFNPILSGADLASFKNGGLAEDIKTEQDNIRSADIIVFIYPVWWTGLPAIMKGYVDRVISYGFAYKYVENGVEGLLPDKKVISFSTNGTPQDVYEKSGMFDSLNQTSDDGIFRFCGIQVLGHHYFSGPGSVDDSARQKMLDEAEQAIRAIK
ncbi:MAG TPA: NAD(P)H-dependent oxidoreductase [Candidatus Paceibacterota bacterium]